MSAAASSKHSGPKSRFPRTLEGENRTKFVNVARNTFMTEQSDVSTKRSSTYQSTFVKI